MGATSYYLCHNFQIIEAFKLAGYRSVKSNSVDQVISGRNEQAAHWYLPIIVRAVKSFALWSPTLTHHMGEICKVRLKLRLDSCICPANLVTAINIRLL